jgi:hypothetical protein
LEAAVAELAAVATGLEDWDAMLRVCEVSERVAADGEARLAWARGAKVI